VPKVIDVNTLEVKIDKMIIKKFNKIFLFSYNINIMINISTQHFIYIIFGLLVLAGIYILYSSTRSEKLDNTTTTTTTSINEDDAIKASYWYNYYPNDNRSKCFDCDATSKYRHGSNCIDCEIEGGRKVNKLLNRYLTR
jgi:hypothetical protein